MLNLRKLEQLIGKDIKLTGDQVALSTADLAKLLSQAGQGQDKELEDGLEPRGPPPILREERFGDEPAQYKRPANMIEMAGARPEATRNAEVLKSLLHEQKMAGSNIEALNSLYHERQLKAKMQSMQVQDEPTNYKLRVNTRKQSRGKAIEADEAGGAIADLQRPSKLNLTPMNQEKQFEKDKLQGLLLTLQESNRSGNKSVNFSSVDKDHRETNMRLRSKFKPSRYRDPQGHAVQD